MLGDGETILFPSYDVINGIVCVAFTMVMATWSFNVRNDVTMRWIAIVILWWKFSCDVINHVVIVIIAVTAEVFIIFEVIGVVAYIRLFVLRNFRPIISDAVSLNWRSDVIR